MLKKFRQNHPVIFCIATVAVCWVVTFIGAGYLYEYTLGSIVESNAKIGDVGTIFCDGVLIIIAILILWATGRTSILAKKGTGFFRGLGVAAAPVCVYGIAIIAGVAAFVTGQLDETMQAYYGVQPAFTTASAVMIIGLCFVGVAEELLCRGIVAQTLLERFGFERAGIWRAAIVSGIIFGLLHSGNFLVGDFDFVAVQMTTAAGGGILYAAIYYRTGNIWIVALAHALNDIMATMFVWLGGIDASSIMSGGSGGFSAFPFVVLVIDVCLSCFLLRSKKIGQVRESWSEFAECDENIVAAETEEGGTAGGEAA